MGKLIYQVDKVEVKKGNITPIKIQNYPYAGDIPYIFFSIKGNDIFINSNDSRQFVLYENITVQSRVDIEDGLNMPEWTCVLSNGIDEIQNIYNCNRYYINTHSTLSQMNSSLSISENESKDFTSLLKKGLIDHDYKIVSDNVLNKKFLGRYPNYLVKESIYESCTGH